MTLQQLFGIELPIIQAPMAGVQGSALAIAVSNAGGLGSLPCAMLGRRRDARRSCRRSRRATSKPYNVNFFCHAPPAPDARREAAWRAALAPYFAEYRHRPGDDRRRRRRVCRSAPKRPTCWKRSGRRW